MTKRDKVQKMLAQSGFDVVSDFTVTNGPKRKSDILECWHVVAVTQGKIVEIYSSTTMTELCRTGLQVVRNTPDTCLYGDYVAIPKPKFLARLPTQ